MVVSRFLAVDWGTTNRRAFLIENEEVVSTERDDHGILHVAPGGFDAEVDGLVARYGDLPILMAGMVGSNRGWTDAGYVPAPADLDSLAEAVVRPRPNVAIVPGVSVIDGGRADVMRGEEVQLLGATAAGLAPEDALLAQPGTHCKWAWMKDGRIADFVTAMTGEMFALLKANALIGSEMQAPVAEGDAFREGVAEAGRGDLLGSLFGVRPAALLGRRAPQDSASYVSGLLIGSDVRAHVTPGDTVHLLADPPLSTLYSVAIETIGASSHVVDSHGAFVAGIIRIQERLQ